MMKGLMGRCLNHEMALNRVRARVNEMEDDEKGWHGEKI